jgi:type VI secretion system protein ImpG
MRSYDRIEPAPRSALLLHHASPAAVAVQAASGAMGPRSSYVGSEDLSCRWSMPTRHPIAATCGNWRSPHWCTNRDLPLLMPIGRGDTDFTLASGAPVGAVRCVAGPTRPWPSHAHGDTAWRLISHLSLNYLSLTDTDARQGAVALRELLALYGNLAEMSSSPAGRWRLFGARPYR